MLKQMRNTLGPLFLILFCPTIVLFVWFINAHLKGSLFEFWQIILNNGFFTTLYQIWKPFIFGSKIAWIMIFTFAIFELMLMRVLPGKSFNGPITPKGNIPTYKANGVLAFIITLITFVICTFYLHLFKASIIYDNFGSLLGALNILSLVFCFFLYIKGRIAPSSTDSGTSGNFIFDYYWGTELYPVFLGWNLKHFVTCRFGMMSWSIILISYVAKQQDLFGLSNSMIISVVLQLMYISKFFLWETGYLKSLDIMHDRAGFYICWGCLVWVPGIYTSPSMYLVWHPIELNQMLALSIFILGSFSIIVNYLADRQRQLVRATHGNCKIWGKSPLVTLATYTTEKGETKSNLLLASGWWGIARHFHYIPEITAAFFWSVPALFSHFIPYFYVCFLAVLLFDRAFRDDKRCSKKYGNYWQDYCKLVPYKIIPFVV